MGIAEPGHKSVSIWVLVLVGERVASAVFPSGSWQGFSLALECVHSLHAHLVLYFMSQSVPVGQGSQPWLWHVLLRNTSSYACQSGAVPH